MKLLESQPRVSTNIPDHFALHHQPLPSPKIYISFPSSIELTSHCDCGILEKWENREDFSAWNLTTRDINSLTVSSGLIAHAINKEYFYVFNASQGTLSVLDSVGFSLLQQLSRVKQFLSSQSDSKSEELKKFVATLVATGILSGSFSQSEQAKLERDKSDTFIAWLHLTNQCNLRCKYCFLNKSSEHMCEHLAIKSVKRIIESAVERNYSRVRLKYAGGEPTLKPDLIMRTHQFAEKLAQAHGLKLEGKILTNGVSLSEKLVDFTLNHDIGWAISMDGLNSGHDVQRPFVSGRSSSTQVHQSVQRLQKRDASFHIAITLTKLNLDHLPALVQELLKQQLPFSLNFVRKNEFSSIKHLHPTNSELISGLQKTYRVIERNLPQYNLLFSLLDRVDLRFPHTHPCAAGHHYVAIDHHGNIVPCQMMISEQAQTLFDSSFFFTPFDRFRNLSVTEKEHCEPNCPWRYYCGGGCPIEAYHSSEGIGSCSKYCQVYRTLAPEILRLEALRLLKHESPFDWQNIQY
jgi:uncharacterized protein